MPEKACPQKMELLRVYQHAALQLVNALTDLQQMAVVMQHAEYDSVHESLESLKAAANKARSQLESHVNEHGC